MFNYSTSLDTVQDGFTALHVAAHKGHCGIVRMLLEAKADVNVQNNVRVGLVWFLHIILG